MTFSSSLRIAACLAFGVLARVPAISQEADWVSCGTARQLTFGAGNDMEPAVGPDGSIAFQSDETGRYVIKCLKPGGKPEVWVDEKDHACQPTWLQDGRLVYVVRHPMETAAKAVMSGSQDGANLWLRQLDGTQVRLTKGLWCDYTPSIAPDGKTLWFVTTRDRRKVGDGAHLASLDLSSAGNDVREHTFTAYWRFASAASPALSPDGRLLAWAQIDGKYGNWRLRLASTVKLTGSAALTEGTMSALAPRWSPDGTLIAFTGFRLGDPGWRVYVLDPLAGVMQRLELGSGNSRNPAWSADGKRIVFESNRSGLYKLYEVDVDIRPGGAGAVRQDTRVQSQVQSRVEATLVPGEAGSAPRLRLADGELLSAEKGPRGNWLFKEPKGLDFGNGPFYVKATFTLDKVRKEAQVVVGGYYPGLPVAWQIHTNAEGKLCLASRSPEGEYIYINSLAPIPPGVPCQAIGVYEPDGTLRFWVEGQQPMVVHHPKAAFLEQARMLSIGGTDGTAFPLDGTVHALEVGRGYPQGIKAPPSVEEIFNQEVTQ
ncbi:MAG: TolB family protein [Lentisphaeria bacterium]|jgi:Tol biopolymer transport system component